MHFAMHALDRPDTLDGRLGTLHAGIAFRSSKVMENSTNDRFARSFSSA
jgi:hypothetical protein